MQPVASHRCLQSIQIAYIIFFMFIIHLRIPTFALCCMMKAIHLFELHEFLFDLATCNLFLLCSAEEDINVGDEIFVAMRVLSGKTNPWLVNLFHFNNTNKGFNEKGKLGILFALHHSHSGALGWEWSEVPGYENFFTHWADKPPSFQSSPATPQFP